MSEWDVSVTVDEEDSVWSDYDTSDDTNFEVDALVWGWTPLAVSFIHSLLHQTVGPDREGKHHCPTVLIAVTTEEEKSLSSASFKKIETVVVDVGDAEHVEAMTSLAKIVLCFGALTPNLLKSCVQLQTHFVHMSADVTTGAEIITNFHEKAKEKGVFITCCCGLSSLGELGSSLAAQHLMAKTRHAATSVTQYADIPGGGLALPSEVVHVAKAIAADPKRRAMAAQPYLLGGQGVGTPDLTSPLTDEGVSRWCAPYVLAPISTRLTRRSHHLLKSDPSSFPRSHTVAMDGATDKQCTYKECTLTPNKEVADEMCQEPLALTSENAFDQLIAQCREAEAVRDKAQANMSLHWVARGSNGDQSVCSLKCGGYYRVSTAVAVSVALCVLGALQRQQVDGTTDSGDNKLTHGVLTPYLAFGSEYSKHVQRLLNEEFRFSSALEIQSTVSEESKYTFWRAQSLLFASASNRKK